VIDRIRALIHRLTAPTPLLDDIQRDVELDTMSPDDYGHVVAYFGDQFPAYFDASLAALGSYRNEIEENA
jgi:hypothetical protein